MADWMGSSGWAAARLLRTGKSKVVLVAWQESVIESGISRVLEDMAGAVAKLGFSLVWQIGFSPEHEQLAANLAPAVVVWLGDDSNTASVINMLVAILPNYVGYGNSRNKWKGMILGVN